MVPILLSLTVFAAWWLVGVALLSAVRADLTSLRVVLTAPALGSALTVIPLFMESSAGVPMRYGGPITAGVLLLGATAFLLGRRPELPVGTRSVIAVCVGGAFLSAWPLIHLGFSWIANANLDMTLYVLSATRLVHHGLLSAVDSKSLSGNHDLPGLTGSLYAHGGRPGTDITLAALSGIAKRPAYQLYMPLGVGLNLVGISSVAALALQASRHWRAALVAAALFAVSPLATFALLQQLLPQVWGLGLASALLALLFRRGLHARDGARMSEVIPIGLIAVALALVYVELASTLVLSYLVYVLILIVRRDVDLAATLVRLWLPVLALVIVVLNVYGARDVDYVKLQVLHATHGAGSPPAFGYALVPSALSAVFGLQQWNPSSTSVEVGVSIVAAALLLAVVLVAIGATFWRGHAAAIALAASVLLALVLIIKVSDFGLFKLAMFVQPFLAAATAVWLSILGRRILVPVALLVGLIVAVQLSVQLQYVRRSVNPIDLRDASAPSLLPAFERFSSRSARFVVSVTDNPVLAKLEASFVDQGPLYLISNNALGERWERRNFKLLDRRDTTTTFYDNRNASELLTAGRCNIVLPSGSQTIINRRPLREGAPDLVFRDCKTVPEMLVFTESTHGLGFYSGGKSQDITLYQLEPDYFFPGRTMSGVGRYLLFRVLRPEPGARLELSFSTTLGALGGAPLPPAAVIGTKRASLPIVGRGSARVFSSPLEPVTIGGQHYVMLDLGRDGTLSTVGQRSVVQGLFSRSVALDPRFLTAYARNISIVNARAYRKLAAPNAVRRFPGDLANENLEYSGIYEDGWVAGTSYVVLAAGAAGTLSVDANVLPIKGQHLDVLVGGHRVASQHVAPGLLRLRVALPASVVRRKVELRWTRAVSLGPLDKRRAAAQLQSVSVERS